MTTPELTHHEFCDAIGMGPDLKRSTKPCNCGAVTNYLRGLEAAAKIADEMGRSYKGMPMAMRIRDQIRAAIAKEKP